MEMPLPSADIVLLIVILLSALIGLVRGLLREVLSLASWFAAFMLALYFAPVAADYLTAHFADETMRLGIGFVAIFVITLIVGGIVQWLLRKLVETSGLSGTDRFLGFLFGGVRGVLVCIIALIMLRPFAETTDWWQQSRLTPQLLAFEQDVLELMGRARELVIDATDQV
jgi:membrane protein required for colicin V production